jgi:hypothetical protein
MRLFMDVDTKIELARTKDAAAVLEVHTAAVHQTASPYYPQEIINSWARLPITNERIERVKQRWIENPDHSEEMGIYGIRSAQEVLYVGKVGAFRTRFKGHQTLVSMFINGISPTDIRIVLVPISGYYESYLLLGYGSHPNEMSP